MPKFGRGRKAGKQEVAPAGGSKPIPADDEPAEEAAEPAEPSVEE
jgi:hypothetical protein